MDVASFVHRRPALVAGRGPFVALFRGKPKKAKKPKEDDNKAAGKVEVTTKKSKPAVKKPKVTAKKATASKAKKKDEGKASDSAPVEDKKTKSKKSSGDGSA